MIRRAGLLSLSLVVACAGCSYDQGLNWLWPNETTPTVPDHPFAGAPVGPVPTIAHAPATEAATRRVNEVGQRLLAANTELPMRPLILGIGSPEPEIFHRDITAIYISDSLVNKCSTDAQLAAVLASELGKMVSTRVALAGLKAQRTEREPLGAVQIGPDTGGTFGPPDGTRLAELGKFEQETHRTPSGVPAPPPDPDVLARNYLRKAGYAVSDLDSVMPLLREAAQHTQIEQQFTTGPIRPFVGP
jgi:hypothetical protein